MKMTFGKRFKKWKKTTNNPRQFGENGGSPSENGFTQAGWSMKRQFTFMPMQN
ncbi:hypothetical protein GCM10009119_36460 [Algoriphagus jejuensis]|uniref:Uncharacterized protein n=1 Tax=Algoriphagus jejuensis TaxID=419934 RepID=A0ABN1N463_9BACT